MDSSHQMSGYQLALSDLERKRTHYIMNSGFIEKYIMVTLQLGTLAGLVYRFGNWAHTFPIAPLRWLLLLPYILFNFSGALAHRHRYPPRNNHWRRFHHP